MSNHAYVQEHNYFSYPQPATPLLMVPYESSSQQASTQLAPYDNHDSMHYSNYTEDDDEDVNTLN